MKRTLCIMLSVFLFIFNIPVYASADYSDTTDIRDLLPEEYFNEAGYLQPSKALQILDFLLIGGMPGSSQTLALSELSKFLEEYDNSSEDISVSENGSCICMNETFINALNNHMQDSVHALDGYYLIEPTLSYKPTIYEAVSTVIRDSVQPNYLQEYWQKNTASSAKFIEDYDDASFVVGYCNNSLSAFNPLLYTFKSDNYYYLSRDFIYYVTSEDFSDIASLKGKSMECYLIYKSGSVESSTNNSLLFSKINNPSYYKFSSGNPVKLFYSFDDVFDYVNNGRTYVPQITLNSLNIPINYYINASSAPSITYNINIENKTETEIQNEYNQTLNNYINNNFFSSGEDDAPTPTPTPDFGDGVTPTPPPDFGDGEGGSGSDQGGSDAELLQQIYEWLDTYAHEPDLFSQAFLDYMETNNGKLDSVIKLLEENNEFQQKLVNSLNEIKAILVTQTVLDLFQDRSSETANKAKEKFPTSIPWDIAMVVNAMSAEPQDVVFALPIRIDSIGINESIVIDLSTEEWEKLAKTCRYLLSIMFVLFMIQLSRKMFFSGGGDD